ncbi:MAG: nucleotidyl transferase AbiEii/AbiGii toxin family protein [Gammaproteobacteria bacterium]|nr:nucleotidyl transferase AbiEii/AbiGii toxin family protein [Gammaproteobacteria bacterium]
MARETKNIAASVRARLRNLAREQRANFQRLLTRYALERFLYRLSVSPHRDLFVLKGAMLYTAWAADPFRMTRDIDLLSLGDHEAGPLIKAIREVCALTVLDDGLQFDVENISTEPFSEDRAQGAFRARTAARLGAAIIPVQIDIGFGDPITPAPVQLEYPVLLDQPAPFLRSYPRETVVAEKFQAIVAHDLANSRMKDFYDLLAMSRLFAFEGRTLCAAIRATFERRSTTLPRKPPPALTREFSEDPRKLRLWQSFVTREPLLIDELNLNALVREIGNFIMPAAFGAIDDRCLPGNWTPGGGWSQPT